jgi:deaminated glutathione amidase
MKAALIQLGAASDKRANLAAAEALVRAAARAERPDLIVLPELWTYLGDAQGARAAAEPAGEGHAWQMLSALARELECTIHGGSIHELADGKVYNTSFIFAADGRQIGRYRKLHLFDMVGSDATYRESATFTRGTELCTYAVGDITLGCAICYDLRFPALFAALRRRGADAIVMPSAFTLLTGLAHWEVLCRARAIETQTYLLAPDQHGAYVQGGELRRTFGNTLIVSPWGQVVARAEDGAGYVAATVRREAVLDVRAKMPVADHHVPIE